MKISLRRSVILTFLIVIVILTWNIMSNMSPKAFTQTCNQLESVQQELHLMTNSVHEILQDLNITHFLCYGTLWGQIRLSRILPWEDNTVMCILNEDISAKDEVYVARFFKNRGFIINYDSAEGMYDVQRKRFNFFSMEKALKVYLPVFELDSVVRKYRRVGWKRRVLPPNCEGIQSLNCFPTRLIKPPLPRKEFGGKLLPVPREGIEIQKYHYRDNWWKEVTIKNC